MAYVRLPSSSERALLFASRRRVADRALSLKYNEPIYLTWDKGRVSAHVSKGFAQRCDLLAVDVLRHIGVRAQQVVCVVCDPSPNDANGAVLLWPGNPAYEKVAAAFVKAWDEAEQELSQAFGCEVRLRNFRARQHGVPGE